jgi:putative hemolysin
MTTDARIRVIDLPSPFSRPFPNKMFLALKPPLEKLLALDFLNRKYREIMVSPEEGPFLEKALKAMNIQYALTDEELERIPASGPLVVVANHPFGALEGLVMASILLRKRRDVKIMANHWLRHVTELSELFLFVDPFAGGAATIQYNGAALKKTLAWLRQEGALGVFPAGAVSHLHLGSRTLADPPWNDSIAGIIRKTNAAVLPMFFKGANGPLFHLAGLIHPRLRTMLLPHAFARKTNARITISIGHVIPPRRLSGFASDRDLIAYLRHRTYVLKCRTTGRVWGGRKMACPVPAVFAHGAVANAICREQETLSPEQTVLETEDFCVHLAEARHIPRLLHEIGRLREHTFRLAGEGTGKEVDLDIFDAHYLHLFLWDKRRRCIAGGYRLGQADVILRRFGSKGLYTTTLFTFKPAFWDHMAAALELGRSFVRPEYQKNYAPLLLLWKGIARFVLANPEYRNLFGPVSIDNEYHRLSRRIIVAYLKQNGYMHELGEFVRPKSPFRERRFFRLDGAFASLLPQSIDDVSEIIADIDAHKNGVPVLLRQYLKLGGKMLGFNVDRDFSNVLDGLVLVDLLRTEQKILQRYLGKEEAAHFLEYHARKSASSCINTA